MRISDWSSDVCSSDLIWARCRKDHFTRSRSNAWQWACLPLDFPLIRRVACWMQATSQFRDSTQPEIQRRGSTSAVDTIAASRIRAACFTAIWRSEEHTSELQSLMRISYAVLCLKKIIEQHKNYINPYQLRQDTNTL